MDVRFPIGQLEVPETITLDDINKWADDIQGYTDRLRDTVKDADNEDLKKTYREGAWSVRQLVHHIADSQINMYQRLKLALTDNNPKVPEFDQELWIKQPDNDLPIDISIVLLENLNRRIVEVAKHLKESELSRTFDLQNEGPTSVGETIAKLSWHENHHLAHIQIALGQMEVK